MESIDTSAPENALKPKTKLTGKITRTTLAGAIIDVGQDLPGVIHISQIKQESVNRVEDILQVGQVVDVWVRRFREDRIELTMIEPVGLEWRDIKPESIVKGKVTRLESYGAFIDIGAERPGLVHVSELTHGYVKTPGEVLHEGDEVEAMVLEVNRRKKQIRLSIKATQAKPEEKPVELQPESRKVQGRKPRKNKKGEDAVEIAEPVQPPDPTAFEIAWQQALERAESKKGQKVKKVKAADRDQEELLHRTLETRLPTG